MNRFSAFSLGLARRRTDRLVAICAPHQSRLHGSSSSGSGGGSSRLPANVPSLKDFLSQKQPDAVVTGTTPKIQEHDEYTAPMTISGPPLADEWSSVAEAPSFYLETYGCQMNSSDSELVHAFLAKAGYTRTEDMHTADVILTNTCAIREGAEKTVWNRLDVFSRLKKARSKPGEKPVVIGVLGCMAERLKTKLLESDRLVDIVAGPDAYRDLPRLVGTVRAGAAEHGVNVQLSQDETYADIAPVRGDARRISAFVSIMRGCANMCSFCIVPFTRGRERSRDAGTIVDEVRRLAEEGYREVTLLGQNVNSYHDAAGASSETYADAGYQTAAGFQNMYRLRHGPGVRFTELLDRVSLAAPGVRIRFTSPHPKDFPDDLLSLLAERDNLAKQVHLPAQSGSSAVLAAMRRGYTREAYLQLAARVRVLVPGVALSTDIIAGFCGETAEDHAQSVSLMREAAYENAFMFAYSMRPRTHAHHKLVDDVPEDVKMGRLHEIIATFRAGAREALARDIGRTHLVLVEGPARKSTPALPLLSGRTDCGKRTIMPVAPVLSSLSSPGAQPVEMQPGDFVAVRVTGVGQTSLIATPLARCSLPEFYAWQRAGGFETGGMAAGSLSSTTAARSAAHSTA